MLTDACKQRLLAITFDQVAYHCSALVTCSILTVLQILDVNSVLEQTPKLAGKMPGTREECYIVKPNASPSSYHAVPGVVRIKDSQL